MSNNGITLGQVVEELNNKADTSLSNTTGVDYVVESKSPTSSDPTWYRVYKSGWVEQGGFAVNTTSGSAITLLKTMADTNYMVFLQSSMTTASYGAATNIGSVYSVKTTTSFQHYHYGDTVQSWYWEVKGMGA